MTTVQIIDLKDHHSNDDPTARIVREQRALWTVYSVRGGYIVTLPESRALSGVFPTEAEAVRAASEIYTRRALGRAED